MVEAQNNATIPFTKSPRNTTKLNKHNTSPNTLINANVNTTFPSKQYTLKTKIHKNITHGCNGKPAPEKGRKQPLPNFTIPRTYENTKRDK